MGKEVVGSSEVNLGEYAWRSSCFVSSAAIVSFTGSERVGKEVGKAVQDRFGKVSPLGSRTIFR